MKDPADKVTGELLDTPKKRGRPATGRALTPAERMRHKRSRDAAQLKRVRQDSQRAVALAVMTDAALIKLAGDCMRDGDTRLVGFVFEEISRRTVKNSNKIDSPFF